MQYNKTAASQTVTGRRFLNWKVWAVPLGLAIALRCFGQAAPPDDKPQTSKAPERPPLTREMEFSRVCRMPNAPPGVTQDATLPLCAPGQLPYPCKLPGQILPAGLDLPACQYLGVLPTRDCSYEGKTWADGAYRVTGRICQLCSKGTWSEQNNRQPAQDPMCTTPASAGEVSHLQIDPRYDCDPNSGAPTSGFAIRLHDGKCQKCMMGAWTDEDPFHCNVQKLTLPTAEGRPATLTLGHTIYSALNNEDFDEVQAFIDSIVQDEKRTPDGELMSWALVAGYENILELEEHWEDQLKAIKEWRTQRPESGAAALIESTYWASYAWAARGHESANKVPEQAFKTADQRMAKARTVLEDAKTYTASNPAWYVAMLAIAGYQGWPHAERIALFNEAVGAAPLYDPIYRVMAGGLTPRWGGSLDDYHRFVRAAVDKTRAADGNILYARLYWYLADREYDKDPFTALKIPWPRMKSGFDDLVSRYPNSQWNLQHYAYFACRAGDGKTFNALLPKLAARLPRDLEMSTPWRDVYTRDYCVSRFSKGGTRRSKHTG